jgi:hypothetical protein
MRFRLKWHRTMTIAPAAALIFATLVHQREVTLLTHANADHWPVGWLAVFAVAALCLTCGASLRSSPGELGRIRHEDALD